VSLKLLETNHASEFSVPKYGNRRPRRNVHQIKSQLAAIRQKLFFMARAQSNDGQKRPAGC
jgi:hypothetical protein